MAVLSSWYVFFLNDGKRAGGSDPLALNFGRYLVVIFSKQDQKRE